MFKIAIFATLINVIIPTLYIFLLLFVLLILVLLTFYFLLSVYFTYRGFPFYVPTNSKKIQEIFAKIDISSKDKFIEIGSGDGRIIRWVYRKYKCRCLGIEINPYLYYFSLLCNRIFGLKKIKIIHSNVFDINLSDANVIYFFLLPDFINKLKDKLKEELRPSTIVISHGFDVKYFKTKLIYKIKDKPFSTYFYKI